MLPQFNNEEYTLTPVKAQRMLAEYDTQITLEDEEIMLELLRKLSKLSVSETLKHVVAIQKEAPEEAVLRQYCQLRNIQVRQVFVEDYTAKHFNRPEWRKIMIILRKQRNKTDLLLFTKWDRFSRNTSDAYQMIDVLKKLGVEPQAEKQPLDLTVPENKMMLAIYLTAREIENDRRGLNTKAGIRQAKKEGRYMGKAPRGYINKAYEDGRRYITIDEPDASMMRWIFNEMGEGLYSEESIMKQASKKGFKIDKNTYLLNLRNPVYCGKIRVPAHNDEPAHLVQALHEPLISESLFFKV